MRSVQINELMFIHAFERDVDFHDEYPQSSYLDLETGEVIWVFEEDEDAEMAEEFLHEHDIDPLWR